MDVDERNFADSLPLVKAAIKDCHFMAIDLEMSGIRHPDAVVDLLDLPEIRYSKYKYIVEANNILQIGLCCGTQGSDNKTFSFKTFNFYTFPCSFSTGTFNHCPNFGLEIPSMEFNKNNGFDFGKCISHGISFVNRDEEAKILRAAEVEKEGAAQSPDAMLHFIGANKAMPIFQILDLIPCKELKNSLRTQFELIDDWGSRLIKKTMEGVSSDDSTCVLGLRPFQATQLHLYILHRFVAEKFPQLTVELKQNKDYTTTVSLHKHKKGVQEKTSSTDSQIVDENVSKVIGFRKVWKMICDAKKPTVFHSGFLDILFLLHYLENPLPRLYSDFKRMKSEALPYTFDTKLLAEYTSIPFKKTRLDYLVEYLGKLNATTAHISLKIADGFTKYDLDGNAYHEAGFDALKTCEAFGYFVSIYDQNILEKTRNLVFVYQSLFLCNTDIGNGTSEDYKWQVTEPQGYKGTTHLLLDIPKSFNTNELLFILNKNHPSEEAQSLNRMDNRYSWVDLSTVKLFNVKQCELDSIEEFGLAQRLFNAEIPPMKVISLSEWYANRHFIEISRVRKY